MAVTDNGTILLTDYQNKNIKALSQDNRVLSVLSLSEEPRAITILNATTAVVAGNTKMLYIINIFDPTTISLISEREVPYRIRAITGFNGFLAVTCYTEPRSTQMITVECEGVWSVSEDNSGRALFYDPEGITTTTYQTSPIVAVTDLGRSTITLLKAEDGMFLKTIDVHGKGLWGITADNDDNVYVCYNLAKEIFVWSNDFKESKILLSKYQLGGEPRRIVYSSVNNRFYVSYRGDENTLNTIGCYQLHWL